MPAGWKPDSEEMVVVQEVKRKVSGRGTLHLELVQLMNVSFLATAFFRTEHSASVKSVRTTSPHGPTTAGSARDVC